MTRLLFLVCGLWSGVLAASAAAPAPVVFQTAPGRFEIVARDVAAARAVTAAGEEMWRTLAAPLGLPVGFSSPVFVRVLPPGEGEDAAPFRVIVEPGGVVSVRLNWRETDEDAVLRRALVQGLLLRLAVSQHGVVERLTVPLWLELGCVGWWRTRADAAQGDAARYQALRQAPPRFAQLLTWQRGGAEPVEAVQGSLWLLAFLQGEAAKGTEWPALVRRLLGGEEPLAALAASYPGRAATAAERELWWQTGWQHLLQARSVPTLDAPESRRALEALLRLVVAVDGADRVLTLDELAAWRGADVLASERQLRLTSLNRLLPILHPFYVNAGVSLLELLSSPFDARPGEAARLAAFRRDWSAAGELEAASRAALDAVEARAAR